MHKQGSGYDIPIALGIVAASGQRDMPLLGKYLIMGELGLDGSVRYVSGSLPMVELAMEMGFRGCILPEAAALEAVDYAGTEIYGVKTLEDVLRILSGVPAQDLLIWNTEAYREARERALNPAKRYMDFSEIIGMT